MALGNKSQGKLQEVFKYEFVIIISVQHKTAADSMTQTLGQWCATVVGLLKAAVYILKKRIQLRANQR